MQRLVLSTYAVRVIRALDTVMHRPHKALDTFDEWSAPDRATAATPSGVVSVMQRSLFTTSGPVAERLSGFAPSDWRELLWRVSTDNPEKSFARRATEVIMDVASDYPGADAPGLLARTLRRDGGPLRREVPSGFRPRSEARGIVKMHGYWDAMPPGYCIQGATSGRIR